VRFVILGGGPAGNTAATVAATLGAEVTLIERDIVGGAAHLWDCIPSKAMIATGGQLSELTRARVMGLRAEGNLDFDALRERVASIEGRLHESVRSLLESQGVRMINGTGRFVGPTPSRSTPPRAPKRSTATRSCSRPGRDRASPSG
jgi:dihydrolipoamide dehydrogenase